MTGKIKALVFTGPMLLVSIATLQATPLVPGGTVSPVPVTAAVPAGTPLLLNSVGDTQGGLNEGFSWKKINNKPPTTLGATGNFINAVYKDPQTGQLDFYYQIQNTFGKAANGTNTLISSFNLTNWGSVVITAVQQLQQSTAGAFFGDGKNVEFLGKTTDSITSISRSTGTGNDLTVHLASALAPGQNTSVLLLKTTSTDFDLGSGTFTWVTPPPACSTAPSPSNLTPCGVADFPTFGLGALEPVVPEPGFYGVLALGMAALWVGVQRRAKTAAAQKA